MPKAQQPAPIHIFRPGRHTAMQGLTLDFSEADLAATDEVLVLGRDFVEAVVVIDIIHRTFGGDVHGAAGGEDDVVTLFDDALLDAADADENGSAASAADQRGRA